MRFAFVLGCLLGILGGLPGLPAPCAGDNQPKPIRIGATISLEGKYREPSSMIADGFRLWAKQVNERGGLLGRPVELILENDRSDPQRTRHLYMEFLDEDMVDLVFSPYSSPLTIAAAEVTDSRGFVMVACGSSADDVWQRGFRYTFGTYALASRYFIGFLDLLARNGAKSVAILFENSVFHTAAAEGAKQWAGRFGLKVSCCSSFEHGREELPGLVNEVEKVKPDALILSAYPPDCYTTLGLLEAASYRPRALGLTIVPSFPDFADQAGKMAEGVFGPVQWEPNARIPFPGTRQFLADFVEFTGRVPNYHAASAFAACQIMEKAVTHNGSLDQDKIRDYIRSLDSVTIVGRFKVDRTGRQIGHSPLLVQWQNGRKEIVYPLKMATQPARF